MYQIKYTRQAVKDVEHIKRAGLSEKVQKLISVVKVNPFQNPPPYEKLTGDLKDLYSRRINIQYRLVYEVLEQEHAVKIIRMWKHYE